MTDAPDTRLLEQFTRLGSEAAFTALVERYVNLVYATALRHTGHAQAAEDIAQAVFIVLARRAGSLGHRTVLPGWLYHTARLTAANWRRAETRRVRREQEVFMQSTLEESAPDEVWRELAPLLDNAVARLGATDRDAIVLRYFQNKSLWDTGTALGIEERAAQKRVARALEKLRNFFAKRGVSSTTAIIAGAVSANSVHAAPVGLAKTISAVAVAKGAAAGSSTLTLVKGALKIMAWTKAKTAIVAGVAVVLSAGTFTTVERVVHSRSVEHGKLILSKVVAANRLWLLAPSDTVTNYSYVFHLQWDKAPGGFIQSPVHVTNPRNAAGSERQGITYVSLLQRLARNPEQVQVRKVTEKDGKITLALKILPIPGAKTTYVAGGKTYPIRPLEINCGNGISRNWRGSFSTGGTNAELVVDAEKMIPLNSVVTAALGTVEESFSDYREASPGNYVPLSVGLKYTGLPKGWGDMVFAWKFKLHDGLWLFDESQYRGEKVAWIDEVVVN